MHISARCISAPQSQERLDAGAVLPSTFSDMLGWHDFVRQTATAYAALTPGERFGTSIMAGNYGEAAALDIYGTRVRLTGGR